MNSIPSLFRLRQSILCDFGGRWRARVSGSGACRVFMIPSSATLSPNPFRKNPKPDSTEKGFEAEDFDLMRTARRTPPLRCVSEKMGMGP